MNTPRKPPPDQPARTAAVAERRLNVVIDAGAGTGKTTIVVARLVEMVAPKDDGVAAIAMSRIAAVTFTRRAAGELRLRIRQSLLGGLSSPETSRVRRDRLSAALSELDAAYVGTIHSFADRLLRMRPREARISPAYEIAEEPEGLIAETFVRLMHAIERDNLPDTVSGTPAAPHAAQAQAALRDALSIGLPQESVEYPQYTKLGLDALVQSFIDTRDVDVPMRPLLALDTPRLFEAMRSFIDATLPADPNTQGGARLHALAGGFRALLTETDPVALHGDILDLFERHVPSAYRWRKKVEFEGDAAGYEAWQVFDGAGDEPGVKDTLQKTLGAWLGPRLLRVRPVVIALYEHTKRRHQLVDQLDLVIKLRDLLQGDLESRRFYQMLFDHIFVDEFQDTDPLQAEIVAYLAERSPHATDWRKAELSPGKLTIVGDPKQSIYRFRRADIETYDAARALIAEGPAGCLPIELEANFRSRAPLIHWFNHRFDAVLKTSPEGKRFEPSTGTVYNHHLAPGRPGDFPPSVHVVPFAPPDPDPAFDDLRRLEGEALAHYLAWLVEESGTRIEDPATREMRPLGFGDIAILCLSTTNLGLLFPQLDALNIPHAARGATLFLRDPTHRQFLLGLRALCDPDDGVAEAALLRPPFFAVDMHDLALERAAPRTPDDPASASEPVERAREARKIIQTLRRNRFTRSPGSTARDLLETTGIGQAIALGPNGLQRLERLRELCLILGQRAIDEHLDFDAVTAQMRIWIDHPVQLDPPHPIGGDAIQIMTTHQAKGLEFPVVVFWDGCAQWSDVERNVPFRPVRDGSAWSMTLHKFSCEVPEGRGLKEREGTYRLSERRRLVYVLATRARDILVLPRAGAGKPKLITTTLLEQAPPGTLLERPAYRSDGEPRWWQHGSERVRSIVPDPLGADLAERWAWALNDAAVPRLRPVAVSTYAHALASGGEGDRAPPRAPEIDADAALIGTELSEPPAIRLQPREGRYGSAFGTTVHRALELLLLARRDTAEQALATAITETGLDHHHKEALADIERTTATLHAERLLPQHGRSIALEYPIAGAAHDGSLLSGVIDFLSTDGTTVDVIDFKTDQPPVADATVTHAGYVGQAHCYAELLGAAQMQVGRMGLLFTAESRVRWLDGGTPQSRAPAR
jgi:ATP-dependent helicase/nuclease subunit A